MRKKKPLIKCVKCGVYKSAKGIYCKPCSSDVKEEYRRNYDKLYR